MAFLTAAQQQDAIRATVGVFNAAPGGYFGNLADLAGPSGLVGTAFYEALEGTSIFRGLTFGFSSASLPANFATAFANQILGTTVSAANMAVAVNFVTGLLAAGQSRGAVMRAAVDFLSNSANSTDANFGTAVQQFINRVTVASNYTITQSGSSLVLSVLQGAIASVTSDLATVTAAIAGSTTVSGQTFTLTTGFDTITGGSGNDTIQGQLSGTTSTLSIGDILNGGGGTDILRIVTTDNNVDTAIATVTNVETLVVLNGAGALATIKGDSDGYTSLSLDKTTTATALAISGFAASTAISIANAGAALTTITYDSVTGTADSATVTVGTAATGAGIKALGIETFNLVTTGKAVLDTANDLANATTINITAAAATTFVLSGATGTKAAVTVAGAGVVTLGTLNASIATVDASASTGGVTATLNAAQTSVKGGSGVDKVTVAVPTTTLSVTTGAGNDTVDVSALVLTTAGTLDGTNEIIAGGDGTDTLVTDEGDLTHVDVKANINKATGFEVLQATAIVTAFAADGFTGIHNFTFTADNTAGGAKAYTMESADSLTLTASNSVAAMTLNPVLDSGTDVLNLTLAASTTGDLTQWGITAIQIETINIVSSDTDAATADTNFITALTVQNNTKINLTGAAALTFTTATGTELTIDGSAATGKLGITVVGGNDTITGGSAVDTINGAGGIDTISGLGGADVITGGAGADNLTGGAAADIFVTGVADATIDAAGVGADKISDFNTGGSDVIRLAAADNVAAADVVAPTAGATGSIAAGGKLTFASADDTLTEQIVIAINETAANVLVFWENGGNTFVYASGSAGNGTDDQLIQLTGVVGLTTMTESIVTPGDFTIA